MKKIILPAVAAVLALSLAACNSPRRLTRLECPEHFSTQNRVAQSADGQTCAYRSAKGSEIALQILQVKDTPENALAPFEQTLRAQTEAPAAPAPGAKPDAKASIDDDNDKDEAHVDLPGIHIDAKDGNADIDVAGMQIKADEDGAVIRSMHDVRLRGEQLSTVRRGFRASYIVAGDKLPDGWKVMGYVAGGPKSGPIALALVRARHSDVADALRGDAVRLVRRNGGV